jgi:hypothetical protein
MDTDQGLGKTKATNTATDTAGTRTDLHHGEALSSQVAAGCGSLECEARYSPRANTVTDQGSGEDEGVGQNGNT